jgi:cell wall-associated NlpC family hydrolase
MLDRDMRAVAVPVTTLWESPDQVLPVDAPMLVDRPDPRAWPAALSNDDRRRLVPRVLTQLLLGEPVQVIEWDGAWARVVAPWQPSERDDRGYPGWVRSAHLATLPTLGAQEAVVTRQATPLFDGANARADVATYATILPVAEISDVAVRVYLPGGGRAWLDREACIVRDTPVVRDPAGIDADQVLDQARRFAGLRYLWGGMSAYGLDCSSLVHITYRQFGAIVPRDANDQAAASTRLLRSDARCGDLLFFQRDGKPIHHVAFALDDPARVLHAANGQAVVDEPMNPDRLATVLDLAGRFT